MPRTGHVEDSADLELRRALTGLGDELVDAQIFQTALQKTRRGAYLGYDFKVSVLTGEPVTMRDMARGYFGNAARSTLRVELKAAFPSRHHGSWRYQWGTHNSGIPLANVPADVLVVAMWVGPRTHRAPSWRYVVFLLGDFRERLTELVGEDGPCLRYPSVPPELKLLGRSYQQVKDDFCDGSDPLEPSECAEALAELAIPELEAAVEAAAAKRQRIS